MTSTTGMAAKPPLQKYTLLMPNGSKVMFKARDLKNETVRYDPPPFPKGFRPICDHGIATRKVGPIETP